MNPFSIHYSRPTQIDVQTLGKQYHDGKEETDYMPYQIEKLQLYNPIYKQFFNMKPHNYQHIGLNNPLHIHDLHTVYDSNKNALVESNVFIKFSPLLDPYRYMIGKYNIDDSIRTLPNLYSDGQTVHSKLLQPHNASYIDNFFCYLSGMMGYQHKIPNTVPYYGSYLGIQSRFKLDVSDDIEYLTDSGFFNKNVGKLFTIEYEDESVNDCHGSHKNKPALIIENTECDLDFEQILDEEIQDDLHENATETPEDVYSQSEKSDSDSNRDSDSNSDGDSDSNDSSVEWSSCSDSREDSEEEEEEDEEEEVYAYINNFPIQMICMEKCDGTLDELFVYDEITVELGASLLFQITMTLLIYQNTFQFTHNDLHTNNVVYSNTTVEFLYYKYKNQLYKVPTYGKIFKIIDFGRSIYKFNDKVFCSDSFAKDGDASAQYNCIPFLDKNKPRLEPNFSFDLCRLGTSIFDFIMDINQPLESFDELQRTIYRWCQDDKGKNILYKKNGNDRYHNFKLYKMIARTVHKHTPEMQLSDPYFKQFEVDDIQEGITDNVICIDQIPPYYITKQKMD